MRKFLRTLICLAPLALAGWGCSSVKHLDTPHVLNPIHWGFHFTKIFGWNEGEFHMLHLNIDRVIFGLDYFEKFENSEPVYTDKV